jgi:hypothetical protein
VSIRTTYLNMLFLILVTIASQLHAQVVLDYSSVVDEEIYTWNPFGYGYTNFGPYTIGGKTWIFYSDGTNAVWKTKQITEGGNWSQKQVLFPALEGRIFNLTYDGTYFHFVRYYDSKILYQRGYPFSSGDIDLDPAIEIYSDPLWNAFDYEQPGVAMVTIMADYRNRLWVLAQVARIDAVSNDTLYKPIILSSIGDSGSWVNRPGYPKDFQIESNNRFQGHGPAIVEIENGIILFLTRIVEPVYRMQARLWIENHNSPDGEGSLGAHETINGINTESTRTSAISLPPGIVMLNTNNTVARRNPDGTWTVVSPSDMLTEFYNTLTVVDGKVRLWDRSGDGIRYRETEDYGATWGPVTTKWLFEKADLFNSTNSYTDQGDHHSLVWITGDRYEYPKTLMMGFEGTIDTPPAPLLVSPSNGAQDVPINELLTWDEVDAAIWYQVQLSELPDFSSIVVDQSDIQDLYYEIEGLEYETTYYWRVRSSVGVGLEGDWSTAWNFTTVVTPPETPLLVGPPDGAINLEVPIEFTWGSSERAEWYHFQLASDQEFFVNLIDSTDISGNQVSIFNLDNNSLYYWRVRAINAGGSSDWSVPRQFTTKQDLPDIPQLAFPENESVNIGVDLLLKWNSVQIADSYTIQVSVTSNFVNMFIDTSGITGTEILIEDLDFDTEYHWRVQAQNSTGPGDWSEVWSFLTVIEPPAVPVLAYPSNGAINIAVDTMLVWESTPRADYYHIQVADEPTFVTSIVDSNGIENSFVSINGMDTITTYYWRVRSYNNGGESDWSTIWSFTTTGVTTIDSLANHIPRHYSLSQNYPNPFNPITLIRYSIPSNTTVRLVVYNMLGQVIQELVDEYQEAGTYEVIFDAKDLPSGMYLYNIHAAHFVDSKRMILIR